MKDGVLYIVDSMVLNAIDRDDLVTPIMNHSKNLIQENSIIEVIGFLRKY